MKIIHAIDQLKMGGAQTHLLTILKEMQLQHPKDTHILLILFGKNEFQKETDKIKVDVIELSLEIFFEKKEFLKAYKKVKTQLIYLSPDLVETHLTWSRFLVNTAAFRLGIKKRIGFEQGDIYMNSLKIRTLNFLSQFTFKIIIVCSDELKNWVMKTHKIKSSKLKVMYNCVDLSKFQPLTNKNLTNYLKVDIKFPEFTFITVGSMGEGVNKRIDVCINAITKLRENNIDAGLIICGDGKNRNKLENLCDVLNVKNSIFFLGNRNDVHKIMPNCYAYLHSAPYEPFGIVCIEAMASGLPVILPNTGGIQRIIRPNVDGFIYKSEDESSLTNTILNFLNSNNYSDISENALERVKKYSAKKYCYELHQLYKTS
jgi:glycosyltransferase involved in cell wall biosynthesis